MGRTSEVDEPGYAKGDRGLYRVVYMFDLAGQSPRAVEEC